MRQELKTGLTENQTELTGDLDLRLWANNLSHLSSLFLIFITGLVGSMLDTALR